MPIDEAHQTLPGVLVDWRVAPRLRRGGESVAALGLLDLAGLASLDSVVETVGRGSPAFVATWPAVIASPPASAASTDAFVAPGAVRLLVADADSLCWGLAAGVADGVGLGFAARARLRAGTVPTGSARVDVDDDVAGCHPWPSRLT